MTAQLVSIIVPCRNERAHVATFAASALAQTLPAGWTLEIVVADGLSDDGTRDVLAAIAAADRRLRVVDNPAQIVSTGLNRALAASTGDVVVRMDVHTDYASDYVAECIATLARTAVDNVGGPWHAVPDATSGATQCAIAAAFQSRWVAGGALSRQLDYDGPADTVYLGAWPRRTFDRFGTFDETLVRNQDDEHNLRIARGGGRIWQSSTIRSTYRPRASLAKVFRQYLRYGYWKPFVMRKHGQAAKGRHFIPALFVVALVLFGVVALAGFGPWPLYALAACYVAAITAMTVDVSRRSKLAANALARVPAVIATYHVAYGIGSIIGGIDVAFARAGRARFGRLTR
jgi:succinoglycan biosynthesis protein ExoA